MHYSESSNILYTLLELLRNKMFRSKLRFSISTMWNSSVYARGVFLYLTYLVLNLVLELVAAVEIKLKLKILQAEHRQVQVSTRIYENKDLDCCRGLFRCLPLLKCVFLILVRYEIFLLRGKLSSHFMTSRSTVSVNRKTSTTSLDLYFVVFAG